MGKKQKDGDKGEPVEIKTLADLVNLNLTTLSSVVNAQVDYKQAALIFTGSRTVTATLKLGIEASKLGLVQIAGMNMAPGDKQITDITRE